MFRLNTPKLTTRLIRRSDACLALGIGKNTFWRVWHSIFTDPRCEEDRREGCERKVFEDELEVAVQTGGGSRARIAVLNYRGKLKRKEIA